MLVPMTRALSGALATSALVMFALMLLSMSWTQSMASHESVTPSPLTIVLWGFGLGIGGTLLRSGRRLWGLAWLLGTGGAIAAFAASLCGLMMGVYA